MLEESIPSSSPFTHLGFNMRSNLASVFLFSFLSVTLSCSSERENKADQHSELNNHFLKESLRPVHVDNCKLKRYGGSGDGGYLMCGNLIQGATAAYSYGIENRDGWGCDLSTELNIPVYQYDPFDTRPPACTTSTRTHFNAEGIAGYAFVDTEGRKFNTIEHHIEKTGQKHQTLLLKMDVEGAEWESLLHASDEVLEQFSQIALELHHLNKKEDDIIRKTLEKLNQHFYLAHIHANNFSCTEETFLPATAVEVLYVNKNIAQVSDIHKLPTLPNPLDESIAPNSKECLITKELFE